MSLSELKEKLKLKECSLVGCTRRNKWAPQPDLWRYLRGNAILDAVARRTKVQTPVGDFEVHVAFGWRKPTEPVILVYRGGRWKPWWTEDLQLLAAIVMVYGNFRPLGIVVLQELDNELFERYIEAPSSESAEGLVQKALNLWADEERIVKNSDRGKTLCPYCPVREQCDLLDLEQGRVHDWPPEHKRI